MIVFPSNIYDLSNSQQPGSMRWDLFNLFDKPDFDYDDQSDYEIESENNLYNRLIRLTSVSDGNYLVYRG